MRKLRKIICIFLGHPKVITTCMGYVYCGRCEEQIGDALGGYFNGDDYFIVGHDCEQCRTNFKKLTLIDKFLTPLSE